MRQELVDLINTQDVSSFDIFNILRSGDVVAIKALINKGGKVREKLNTSGFGDTPFAEFSEDQRLEIFRLFAAAFQPSFMNAHLAGHQALAAQDINLFDEIIAWSGSEAIPEQIVWSYSRISFHQNPEFWTKVFSRLDATNEYSISHAQKIISRNHSFQCLMLMVIMGLPLRKISAWITPKTKDKCPAWLVKLLDIGASAHGELAIKNACPSLEEAAHMSDKQLTAVFKGLST